MTIPKITRVFWSKSMFMIWNFPTHQELWCELTFTQALSQLFSVFSFELNIKRIAGEKKIGKGIGDKIY